MQSPLSLGLNQQQLAVASEAQQPALPAAIIAACDSRSEATILYQIVHRQASAHQVRVLFLIRRLSLIASADTLCYVCTIGCNSFKIHSTLASKCPFFCHCPIHGMCQCNAHACATHELEALAEDASQPYICGFGYLIVARTQCSAHARLSQFTEPSGKL